MGDGLRTIHVVTTDESLIASTRAAVEALGGWEVRAEGTVGELTARPPARGDVILLDTWLRSVNVYESCRALTGKTRCRTFVVSEHGNTLGEPIARFCGATGLLARPLTPTKLRQALEDGSAKPAPALPADVRGADRGEPLLPERLLLDLSGRPDESLVQALTDPETSLFNYPFLNYKLDEEFKRARRFDEPLACVMLGFEGQASSEILRELAGIFLVSSRDTDILGRFDESSFLFLLPSTGPDGADVMARRVAEMAHAKELSDLVGDPLVMSIGISSYPNSDVTRREDLLARAREAFFAARAEGGGVVTAA